ncbi:MAG: hypothetical protein HY532_00700 [Chloroflexi bacterium]|nr:hypothetical protein [Chloroflexota bacterium]
MMEKGRLLSLAAAVFLLASLAFPYWTAKMNAPTYPEQDLVLHMYAFTYQGDIEEWNLVGRLVGVRVPPPIPDAFFLLFPASVVVLVLLALVVAATRRLNILAAVLPWALMAVVLGWGQYSLYLFGHNLDPERPLRYFDTFTPPIVGVLTLGKIKTYHYPDVGTLLFGIGTGLLVVNAWLQMGAPLPRGWPRKRNKDLLEGRYASSG